MPDTPLPLRHSDTPTAEDAALAQASRSHVAGTRALQLMAELIQRLRDSRFSWWTPEQLRDIWDATRRMTWFAQRPDIRQRITCGLTGLRPRAARGKEPEFQAGLIDSVIDDGDVTLDQFESSFDAIELAAYAPVAEIWQQFRERMPWDQDIPPHQELIAWIFDRLLASSSTIDGMTREPILTPYAIRTTIPGRIWHAKLPLEVRVAIDELRFEHERMKPGEPFHAVHDLSVATPTIIAANIPLRDLICVFDVAEKALGLAASHGASTAAPSPRTAETVIAMPSRTEVKPQPATPHVDKILEKAAELAKTDSQKTEVKEPAPAALAEKAPETMTGIGRPETPKADVKAPAERAPEKPADKVAERLGNRWERMASKVLERVGKESDSTVESPNPHR